MTLLNLTEVTASKTDQSAWNNVQDALTGEVYPRTAGVATDKAGDLGTSTYGWLTAHIVNGWLTSGMLIPWYDYNGTLSVPQGYMVCDGSVVTATTYDAQHNAGDYATYIGSSPLDNLNLPSLSNKFVKGTTGSTQSGASAITYSGNAGNTIDMSHDHGGSIDTGTGGNASFSTGASATYPKDNTALTHKHNFTIPSNLSASQTILPLNIGIKYLIRIAE